jgi:hypothetical protein
VVLRARIVLTAAQGHSNAHIARELKVNVASWMNQVEIWLSVLVRKLLKRGNFRSLDDLRDQILAFIAYYNRTMANPSSGPTQGSLLIVELLEPLCTRPFLG